MGNLFSHGDIAKDVDETIRVSFKEMARLQRNIYRPGCPGLSMADIKSTKKYKNVPVSDKYSLVDSGPIDAGTMSELCTSIRRREAQKVHLVKTILQALDTYKNVLSWLIDGDYCATASPGTGLEDKKWQIARFREDNTTRYIPSTCGGVQVPLLMALTKGHEVAGDLAWDKVYRLDDRENARWRAMVDHVRSDFTSGWRRLKKVLHALLTDEVLPAKDLVKQGRIIDTVIADIEASFQDFMHMALDNDMVRPFSVAEVNERRLRKTVENSEIRAQKDVIGRAGKESYRDMLQSADARWHMPLSAAPSAYGSNHFYKDQ